MTKKKTEEAGMQDVLDLEKRFYQNLFVAQKRDTVLSTNSSHRSIKI